MADTKKNSEDRKSVRETNFDNARKTAALNHERHDEQNMTDGNDGVEVRPLEPIEVINPVRNSATGELEDDTRVLKQSHEQALGLEDSDGKTTETGDSKKASDTKTETKK